MSIDTDALKAGADIVEVIRAFTPLKKAGTEWCGPCPLHGGDGNNFYVNPRKGIWSCFSRGCHECEEGNDVIGFIRRMENLTFQQACERLGAKSDWKPAAPREPVKPPPQERRATKPPEGAGVPLMALKEPLGEPARVWPYRDTDGAALMYVARYETPEGKEIRCWVWSARPGEDPDWHCHHWNRGERPLYNLDQLTTRYGAPVMVVEGEKAADAASVLLPQYVVTTWPGGANAWKHADLNPLKSRRVDLWPDADKAGTENMEKLAAVLADPRGLACHGKIIGTDELPEGFDAADWHGEDIVAWLKKRARVYAELEAPKPAPPPAEPPPPDDLPPPYDDDPPPDDPEGEEPLPASMSEDFLANRFAQLHASSWRYVRPWGSWFEWRGDGWYKDDTAKIDRLAVELTRKAIYWSEGKALSEPQRRLVNSRRTAGAVRDIAVHDRRIAATVDQWDTHPLLIGVPGGVVDLETGKLTPGKPEQYLTKRTRCAPAAGDAPIWRQFLNTVTADNPELIAFLQRFAGYSLTGETREQCLAFLYGTGQNGKGVFIRTIAQILGDYACTADADVFMESDAQRHPTEMARLRGARLVSVDETDSNKRWNEKRIKRVTGGGKIEAHFMRQDDFEFEPQFKLLIAGNHKPQLRGVGKAIQRRIHLVPFTVTIPDSERDDKLVQKLEAEYPQILAWMIVGARDWLAGGLKPPQQIVDATSHYIEAEDTIGEWLEERTEQAGRTERPQAYKNYRGWIESRGERSWSAKSFWSALEERGYTAKKSNGVWFIDGLQLKIADYASSEPPGYEVD